MRFYIILILCFGTTSCLKRQLNEKPDSKIIVPTTKEDFQRLLNNTTIMNVMPGLGEVSSDLYYLVFHNWNSLSVTQHNAYVWARDIYGKEQGIDDYNAPYTQAFYANVILEGLEQVPAGQISQSEFNQIKGAALFARGFAFYNLVSLFAAPYQEHTAIKESGIILRLQADINVKLPRATVGDTYTQITRDLEQAAVLLPAMDRSRLNRSSRPAALALLARVFLSMRQYDKAFAYADSCLLEYSTLLDFNTLNLTAARPFHRIQHPEILFECDLVASATAAKTFNKDGAFADSTLIKAYAAHDLRRSAFYFPSIDGQARIKGSYTGGVYGFGGLATDEVFLIRAECHARANRLEAAIHDLDTLRRKRYETGHFEPVLADTKDSLLALILTERRKELAYRTVRWTDLRRLHLEGPGDTLRRSLDGQLYSLPPRDKRYILSLPTEAVELSGVSQNDR